MTDQEVLDVAQTCRAANFDAVEARFRRDNPARMAPDLMTAVQACLTSKGFAVTGREENPEDLIRLVPRERIRELAACVQDSGRRLYPELPIEFP